MIDSRDIKDLHPTLQRAANELKARMKAKGYDMGISSTYRDYEMQNEIYAQGRTKPGAIVTNAKGGESNHNYKLAFDIFKNVKGGAYNDLTFFDIAGQEWEDMGGVWGGRWKNQDLPHMEYTAGLTIKQLQAGAKLDDVSVMAWETVQVNELEPRPPIQTEGSPSLPVVSDIDLIIMRSDSAFQKRRIESCFYGDLNYVKLRDIIDVLGLRILYDDITKEIIIRD